MSMINSINFGNDTHSFTLPYGVCSTAAATAAKTVTVDNFSLETGATVIVKFDNANSIASPTLNVNGTGAKPIYRYGSTAASTSTTTTGWRAGAVQMFTYDGTGWIRDFWENTTYSQASLGQGYGTCTTAAATVAKVVTLSSYSLAANGIVSVKFTYNVPASATMNINSKGAKAIYYRGAAITDGIIAAGDIATFIYNGSQYHLIAIDRNRFYSVLAPYGTSIPANADLNTTTYLKVGNYYCSKNVDAATLINCPSTNAFMMTVISPLSTSVDNETTGTWVYRLRKLQVYTGAEFVQYCYSNGTAGNWTYGNWEKVMKSNHFAKKAELTSGTKIGSITIDGDTTTFYAPTSSIYIGEEDTGASAEVINVDTFGGQPPSYYASADAVIKKTGDTMTGKLTLSGDPTENLQAATKQYVDNKHGVDILWTNPDPTASFEAQDVIVANPEKYIYFIIRWMYGTNATAVYYNIMFDGDTTQLKYVNNAADYTYNRSVSLSNGVFTFAVGQKTSTTNNAQGIPVAIIGVR